jgi:penicillin amidase
MLRIIARILLGLLALIVVVIVAVVIYVYAAVDDSFPQTSGEISLQGLDGPVDVYRDQYGIPQIYASTEHDLFFAQGYVHAQDRFWQMDFQRHVGSGRLSELISSNGVETDEFLRTMGWERVAKQELENLDEQSRSMLESYAEGVNAYLADHSGTQLSLEYLFLKILNGNYQPAAWEPLNSVTWAKAMAWDLRGNMDEEIERAILLKTLSPERIAELFPDYPASAPVILPDFSLTAFNGSATSANPADTSAIATLLNSIGQRTAALDTLLNNDPNADLGSNSWVVSGDLSATGVPLMANDPHLGASIPSIWYQIGLHCQPVGPDCSYEAAGVSFVGVPGIVLGHNNRIAWSFTNMGPDVMDLYIIKVNPDDPNQYEMNGEWVDMEVINEDITVAGGENIDLPVRITEFGPIISESYGDLADFDQNSGVDLPEDYAIALKWTALEPGKTMQSLFDMNRAQNFKEFRAAASDFVVPSQNLLYADVDGNIGYQTPGYIPIRAAGDGRYPSPGWTDEYVWRGYIPFSELPFAYNPASGFIVTANNAVVDANYPYQIADTWDYGFRAQRILDMINGASGPLDIAAYQHMQGDDMNLGALPIVSGLAQVNLGDAHLNELRDLLASWDGQQTLDSAPAALFNAFWKQLLADTFRDELPETYWPEAGSGSSWYEVMGNLMDDPQNPWWDDTATDPVEFRNDILIRAFTDAVAELEDKLGKDSSMWAWGDLHTITFEHALMSNFPVINSLFNRGPFPIAGGNSIVNATSWGGSEDYSMTSGVSKRTIMDLSNWEDSLQIATVGQSGHAYNPHYADIAPLWAAIQYLPMHWDLDAIDAAASDHLELKPAN